MKTKNSFVKRVGLKSISLFLIGFIVLWMVVFLKPVQAQPIIIKFASAWASGLGPNLAMKWAGDEIEKRTGGRVKFEYYWAGSMVTAGEERPSCVSGVIDMTQLHSLYYLADMPLSDWSWGIPFITKDERKYIDISRKLWEEFPQFRAEIEKFNLKAWPPLTWSSYEMTTKFPLKRLSDLKGHKVNFAGKFTPKWGRAVGCTTVSIVLGELFSALQAGVAEGGNWTTDFMLSYKLDQAGCKYITFVGMGCRMAGHPVMNMKKWNSLPPDIQKIVDSVVIEALYKSADFAAERAKNLLEEGKGRVTFNTLPKEDSAEWARLCKPAVLEWVNSLDAAGLPGTKFAKRIVTLHDEFKVPMPYKYFD